jgi:hypothetical protein
VRFRLSVKGLLLGLVLASAFVLMQSCSWLSEAKPSLLIIAVDHLMDADLNCHQLNPSQPRSGFRELCGNSIRFTHAFSTSTLSQPAMTSLLTGLYPAESGVRDNGANFLSAQRQTLAKLAKGKSFRTSFFSGGAPLLRNSGLQQGFDLFEDSIPMVGRKFFRSADEIFKIFVPWVKSSSDPFFSVLYLTDLNFIHQPTNNEFGEARNLSLESQLEEIDLRLFQLIQELKKIKRWDATEVLLVGLQGRSVNEHNLEFANLGLRSDQARIAMLFKPAAKPRDQGLSWSVDMNTSLADWQISFKETIFKTDLAQSVFEEALKNPDLPRVNLAPFLQGPTEAPADNRWILTENQWGPWRGLGPSALALRKGQSLLVGDSNLKLYSTLTDQFENSGVLVRPSQGLQKSVLVENFQNSDLQAGLEILQKQRMESPLALLEPEVLKEIFELAKDNKREIPNLAKTSENPSVRVAYFLARHLIRRGQWQSLGNLGKQFHIHDWQALAERNLGQRATAFDHPCLRLLDQVATDSDSERRACLDKRISFVMDWFKNESDPALLKKILQVQGTEQSFNRLYEVNWGLQLPWNISEQRAVQNFIWLEALSLPSLQKLKVQLNSPATEKSL